MKRTGWILLVSLLAFACAKPIASDSLRTERDRAVRAGVRWLDSFLADPQMSAALGVDAVGIFSGYAASAEDDESRVVARSAAIRQAQRLTPLFLAEPDLAPAVILDLLYLLVEMDDLGLDTSALAVLATREIAMLPSPNSVYGEVSLDRDVLRRIPAPRFMGLVLGVYSVERAAAYGYDFGIQFGLEEFLSIMRKRPVRQGDRDDLDNATHIAYLFNEYGRLLRTEADLPEAFDYAQRAFPSCLAARNIDLVGEIVDIWRNIGRDETNSEAFREGTQFLLETQNSDGSWGNVDARDPYAATHPAWCAIMALGERRFQSNTPYERRLQEVLSKRHRHPHASERQEGSRTGS